MPFHVNSKLYLFVDTQIAYTLNTLIFFISTHVYKIPYRFLLIHLGTGPTAYYKLSSFVAGKSIPGIYIYWSCLSIA